MKNQYVGDIGDYGKYGLLRAFANAGVKIGVNWYLTKNDGSTDGKFVKYLQSDDMRRYDPSLFEELKEIAGNENKTVQDIQNAGIIPGGLFYDELLDPAGSPKERESCRKEWFENSLDRMKDVDLIFMDPDNGLLTSGKETAIGTEKYIFPDEVEKYYKAGHNVVYYCHRGRRKLMEWDAYISYMFDRIPDAMPAVLTYHKGTQRSYVFLIHKESFMKYRKIIDDFCRKWYRIFNEEYTNKGDVAGKSGDEALFFDKADGTSLKICKRADGNMELSTSDNPGRSMVITPEMLCRLTGI